MLVFLPGQGEIRRVAETLEARIKRPDVDVAPLYGAMDSRAQDRAVEPAPPGRRKIVLATSIAETSLTIEGVRVVIDSGLMRVPRLRARHRPHAARDRARLARQRRPAARPRRPRRARRLLPAVGGGGDRRPRALRRAGNPVGRPLGLPARLRRLGRDRPDAGSPFSIRRRAARSPRRARCSSRSARSTRTAASPTRAGRSRGSRCRRGSRAWSSTRRARAKRATRRRDRGAPHRARPRRRRGRPDDAPRSLPPRPLAARRGRAAARAGTGAAGAGSRPFPPCGRRWPAQPAG